MEDARTVIVRAAAPTDAGPVAELLSRGAVIPRDVTPHDVAGAAAAIVEIAGTEGSDVLVAELNDEVVGVCQLITFRHLQHGGGRCAEIESMHVHTEVRGTGIGTILLDAAVQKAQDLGCYRIQLTSNVERRDAHRFYERHGFVPSHVGFKRLL